MKLILLPQASGELADGVEYYEGEEAGLGERLWLEVDDHLRWIAANPPCHGCVPATTAG